jgi:hypothetical protein
MPTPGKLEKAVLTELWPGSDDVLAEQNKDGGAPKRVTVQFNPQTLKLSFANQNAGGDQPGGSPTQFVGKGTTKLSLELWFDVTLPLPTGADDPQGDVRNLTKEVAFFMTPQSVTKDGQTGLLPPGVQFQWGTFLFKGTLSTMDETLELFSEDGKPLRAGVQLSLSKQDLAFEFGKAGEGGEKGGPGTQPMEMARDGDTVQGAAARAGVSDWKGVAIANGIENPRLVAPGALLNVTGGASASGAASLGLTGGAARSATGASAAASASGAITVAGSGSGSSGLSASASLRFTGPSGPTR